MNDSPDTEANKKIILHMIDCWNQGNLHALFELMSPGCLIHDERGGTLGLDESRSLVAGLLNCFPDYALDCRTLIAEGDKVVAEYMARGTLQRDFMGIPARGQQFEVPAAEIYRIENGKVVETWWFQDSSLIEKQLRSQ